MTPAVQIRIIGWFYLTASVVGVVGGVVTFVRSVETGDISFSLPLLGMSSWAVGRGLLRGSRRAWWWARGLAGAMAPLLLLFVSLMQIFPQNAQFSTPFGTRAAAAGDPVVLLGGAAMIAFLTWQFLVLNSPAVRRQFDTQGGDAAAGGTLRP